MRNLLSYTDPMHVFDAWFAEAVLAEMNDPNAMTLATVGEDGSPSARIVLLKHYDANGFVFFTNLQSQKARDIDGNQSVALCFHWKSLQKQVRVKGIAHAVESDEVDAYFVSRPRESQIGAWASAQSRPLESRKILEDACAAYDAQFQGVIPRPPHWGGFRVVPGVMEFWEEQPFRLHNRFVYQRKNEGFESENAQAAPWKQQRLYP